VKQLTRLQTWGYLPAHRQALFGDVCIEVEYLYVGHPPGEQM
jgi:hypothetical protein